MQVVVLELEDDARLAAEHDDARPRRLLAPRLPPPPARAPPPLRCRRSARRGRRRVAGTGNSCDVSVSPSTIGRRPDTVAPGGQPGELRAALRVGRRACACAPPTFSVTAWSATLLPIRSRTTRTDTVPIGQLRRRQRHAGHRAGSGIVDCAHAARRRSKQPVANGRRHRPQARSKPASQLRSAVLAEPRVGIVRACRTRAHVRLSGRRHHVRHRSCDA